jgi:hypothetical protein
VQFKPPLLYLCNLLIPPFCITYLYIYVTSTLTPCLYIYVTSTLTPCHYNYVTSLSYPSLTYPTLPVHLYLFLPFFTPFPTVCMYVCVCMLYMYICYVCLYAMCICMYICIYACTYICILCMYVCVCMYIYKILTSSPSIHMFSNLLILSPHPIHPSCPFNLLSL